MTVYSIQKLCIHYCTVLYLSFSAVVKMFTLCQMTMCCAVMESFIAMCLSSQSVLEVLYILQQTLLAKCRPVLVLASTAVEDKPSILTHIFAVTDTGRTTEYKYFIWFRSKLTARFTNILLVQTLFCHVLKTCSEKQKKGVDSYFYSLWAI